MADRGGVRNSILQSSMILYDTIMCSNRIQIAVIVDVVQYLRFLVI